MKNTPINNQIVKKAIEDSGLPAVGKASIREIKGLINQIEEATGERYIRMEMGIPGLKPSKIAIEAEKKALSGVGVQYDSEVVYHNLKEEWDKQGLIEWSKTGNPRKIIFADEKDGKKKQDIWNYKDLQYPTYPTEKNFDLLKDIILASSNEDSFTPK